MPSNYEVSSNESSPNEKLEQAKAFLENLGEGYEISSFSSVGGTYAGMVVDGRNIWVDFTQGRDSYFDFTIDGVDFCNDDNYRTQASSILESAHKKANKEMQERYVIAVSVLDNLTAPIQIDNISFVNNRAVHCAVDGHRIEVNFVDGFNEEDGFELSVDGVDFTEDKRYRDFALNLLENARRIKGQEIEEQEAIAKNFLDNLPESYEIVDGRLVTGSGALGTIDGHIILVGFVDGFNEEDGFELKIDSTSLTNTEQYRKFALNFLSRIQNAEREVAELQYEKAVNFLDNLPESYEIEDGRSIRGLAAVGTIDGKKVWVNFEGFEEGADFELTIDKSEFTNNEQYRKFAVSFFEQVKTSEKPPTNE